MSSHRFWERWGRRLLRERPSQLHAVDQARDGEKARAERETRQLARELVRLRALQAERDLYQRRARP